MSDPSSRRTFLAGLALPAVAGARTSALSPADQKKPELEPAKAAPAIQYRTLGRTGLKVSTVGVGCMITSDASVLERAADMGINYFDTARVYQNGNNERMVGAALKSRRKKLIISTKTLAQNRDEALRDLDASLNALSTDYIDIWYLHDKRRAGDITDDLILAQQLAKKRGKIRFAGVSLHAGHAEVIPAAAKNGHFDVMLVTYNFAMQGKFDNLIGAAAATGLGVVAMKVMAGSLDLDPSINYRKSHNILKREGAALAALKYVVRNPAVHTSIPSITDVDQLEENVRAMAEPFQDSDARVLQAQLEHIRPVYCRMCGECDGTCPKGLPVADILRYLTYADGYGQFALGREHFLSMPSEARQVRCDLCDTCSVVCPHGVKVADRLSRAQELFG